MTKHLPSGTVMLALAAVMLLGAEPSPSKERAPANAGPVRIGIVNTLFRDIPDSLVLALMDPFAALMEAQTGLKGQLTPTGNAFDLGRKLVEDQVQIGVFQGIDYAWAQKRYPELLPLVVVSTRDTHPRAYLVTRGRDGIHSFAPLRGKPVAMVKFNHEHCYRFMERFCHELDQEPAQFFSKITKPLTAEDALDDVFDGKVAAAIVEGVPLDCYKRRKPGRFAELNVALESEVFPVSVIVCHRNALPADVVRRLREGMLDARNTALGRQVLMLWKVSGFAPIPVDYQATCERILKDYPPLTAATKSTAAPAATAYGR